MEFITKEKINYYSSIKLRKKERKEKVRFICEDCGKETIQSLETILNHLLCKGCKIKRSGSAYRSQETMLKKYGVKSVLSLKSTHEKKNKVLKEKYGVENYSQIPEKKKELQQKREQFYTRKYGEGFTNCSQLQSYKEKRKQSTLKKYGVEHTSQVKSIKEKQKRTNIEKYGTVMATNNSEIALKTEKTMLERYGVRNCQQNAKIRQKTEQTFINNYGCKKICWYRKYNYNNILFDSSWELAFYIWNIDHNINIIRNTDISFKYFWKEKEHVYFPDFIIEDKIYEIKGGHLISQEKWQMKKEIVEKENIIIITDCSLYLNYIKENYGKNYLKSFIVKTKN